MTNNETKLDPKRGKRKKHLLISFSTVFLSLLMIVIMGFWAKYDLWFVSASFGVIDVALLWIWKPIRRLLLVPLTIAIYILWIYTMSFISGYTPCEVAPCPADWIRSYRNQKECLVKGDKWELGGISSSYHCVHYYRDGGIDCSSSDQCEGFCQISDEAGKGTCEVNDSPFENNHASVEECPQGGCIGWHVD